MLSFYIVGQTILRMREAKKVNKFLKEIEEYDTQNTRCHIYNAGHNIFELYKFLVPVQVATNKTKRDINQYNEFGIRVA